MIKTQTQEILVDEFQDLHPVIEGEGRSNLGCKEIAVTRKAPLCVELLGKLISCKCCQDL